jgi:hypothetical protein
MRLVRSSILTAAAGLALAAGPALAHEAPPLPPVAGADYLAHGDGPPPMPVHGEMHRDMRPDMPPRPGEPRMGYGPEQRADWIDECTHRLGDSGAHDDRYHRDEALDRAHDQCVDYLSRYEASQGGGYSYAQYGAGYAQAAIVPGCAAAGCAYPAAPPGMMWVPVVLTGGQNCCCKPKPKVRTIVTEEEVPEKIVTYEAPPKVVRTKYTKTVPVKTTKPIKSIK